MVQLEVSTDDVAVGVEDVLGVVSGMPVTFTFLRHDVARAHNAASGSALASDEMFFIFINTLLKIKNKALVRAGLNKSSPALLRP